jgi:hypothetical protein
LRRFAAAMLPARQPREEESEMWNVNVVRIYTGADNRSYFEELRLPMEEIVQGDRVSERSALIPTSNMLFRRTRGRSVRQTASS